MKSGAVVAMEVLWMCGACIVENEERLEETEQGLDSYRVLGCNNTGLSGACGWFFSYDLYLADNNYCDLSGSCLSQNNTWSSVSVEPNSTALLCNGFYYGSGCRYFGTAGTYNLGSYTFDTGINMNNAVSSVESYKADWANFWSSSTYLANYPHDDENGWSEEAQGVAHDASHWYVSTKWWIRKFAVTADISTALPLASVGLPHDCQHFGDLDQYAGEVFVAVEDCNGGTQHRIYVYNTDLTLLRWAVLPQAKASWSAVNPTNGLLYSSNSEASPTDRVYVYPRTFDSGITLSALYTVQLGRSFVRIQGGTFSDAGHLYLMEDDDRPPPAVATPGIYAYRIRGRTATQIRYIDPNGFAPQDEEIEGITIWNLDSVSNKHPSVAGHIHWILLDNDLVSEDDVYMKHISVDVPSRL